MKKSERFEVVMTAGLIKEICQCQNRISRQDELNGITQDLLGITPDEWSTMEFEEETPRESYSDLLLKEIVKITDEYKRQNNIQ